MLRMVHVCNNTPSASIFTHGFLDALKDFGRIDFVHVENDTSESDIAAVYRQADVALTGYNSTPVPISLADDPGRLKYICNISGSIKDWIPAEIANSSIIVSNWGDAPAFVIAEGAVALLMAVLKDIREQIEEIRGGGWHIDYRRFGGSLFKANVGIFGCGFIGQKFIELIRAFEPVVRIFDPHCKELPEGCIRTNSLHDLFAQSEIIAIHAGLTENTRCSVNAEMLSLLPKHGVVINTARGAIIDQEALFKELESGRLRAGLDVLEPDRLSTGHPSRQWRNCIFTAHQIGRGWPRGKNQPKRLQKMHQICLDNLNRFIKGEPIRFTFDSLRYCSST